MGVIFTIPTISGANFKKIDIDEERIVENSEPIQSNFYNYFIELIFKSSSSINSNLNKLKINFDEFEKLVPEKASVLKKLMQQSYEKVLEQITLKKYFKNKTKQTDTEKFLLESDNEDIEDLLMIELADLNQDYVRQEISTIASRYANLSRVTSDFMEEDAKIINIMDRRNKDIIDGQFKMTVLSMVDVLSERGRKVRHNEKEGGTKIQNPIINLRAMENDGGEVKSIEFDKDDTKFRLFNQEQLQNIAEETIKMLDEETAINWEVVPIENAGNKRNTRLGNLDKIALPVAKFSTGKDRVPAFDDIVDRLQFEQDIFSTKKAEDKIFGSSNIPKQIKEKITGEIVKAYNMMLETESTLEISNLIVQMQLGLDASPTGQGIFESAQVKNLKFTDKGEATGSMQLTKEPIDKQDKGNKFKRIVVNQTSKLEKLNKEYSKIEGRYANARKALDELLAKLSMSYFGDKDSISISEEEVEVEIKEEKIDTKGKTGTQIVRDVSKKKKKPKTKKVKKLKINFSTLDDSSLTIDGIETRIVALEDTIQSVTNEHEEKYRGRLKATDKAQIAFKEKIEGWKKEIKDLEKKKSNVKGTPATGGSGAYAEDSYDARFSLQVLQDIIETLEEYLQNFAIYSDDANKGMYAGQKIASLYLLKHMEVYNKAIDQANEQLQDIFKKADKRVKKIMKLKVDSSTTSSRIASQRKKELQRYKKEKKITNVVQLLSYSFLRQFGVDLQEVAEIFRDVDNFEERRFNLIEQMRNDSSISTKSKAIDALGELREFYKTKEFREGMQEINKIKLDIEKVDRAMNAYTFKLEYDIEGDKREVVKNYLIIIEDDSRFDDAFGVTSTLPKFDGKQQEIMGDKYEIYSIDVENYKNNIKDIFINDIFGSGNTAKWEDLIPKDITKKKEGMAKITLTNTGVGYVFGEHEYRQMDKKKGKSLGFTKERLEDTINSMLTPKRDIDKRRISIIKKMSTELKNKKKPEEGYKVGMEITKDDFEKVFGTVKSVRRRMSLPEKDSEGKLEEVEIKIYADLKFAKSVAYKLSAKIETRKELAEKQLTRERTNSIKKEYEKTVDNLKMFFIKFRLTGEF